MNDSKFLKIKNTLILTSIIFITLSCSRTEDYNETNWKIINVKVNQKDWVKSIIGNNQIYYKALVNVPEITDFVYNSGTVLGYIETDNGVQQVLPYVRHLKDDSNNYWTQTVDFDFANGSVQFYVTTSDFTYPEAPETMYFRLVLMW